MKTRKELPRTALPRIYFIDRQIASGAYPNTRLLAETYEISEATVSRDIEFMRNMLNAPIAFDHAHNGYYYEDKTFRLSAGYATAEEMLVLGMVKNLLSLYHDTPVYETMRQLLDIISAPIAAAKENSTIPGWYEDRIVVPPIASAAVSPEIWAVIVKGLRDNRMISFNYTGSWDNEPQLRKVCPCQLLFDTGVWYLYARDEDRSDFRIFSLSRMQNAAPLEKTFTLPVNYDYSAHADGSFFGVFHGKEKKHFRVVFFDEAFAWAKERKWAADQIIEENSYSVTVDFTSTQYDKVLEWVLSRGSNARPIEPPELVKDWKNTINEMQKRANE
jgi:predicted DNA-binding transcriptional regulator YafY